MIIGSGAYQYEVVDQWGRLPVGVSFGTTHGVTEDAQGRIIIHHTGKDCTIFFDPEGNAITWWGADYATGAHGMFLNREKDGEFLYLSATSAGVVVKTTLEGEEVSRIGTPPRPDIYDADRRFVPTETAVSSSGEIYIADGYGQPWVHRYSPAAEYLDSFGGPGKAPGQLNNPHGVKTDTRSGRELLLVADRGNRRLQYFTLDGEFVRSVDDNLRLPCTALPWRDELYVPDLHSRLTILDKNDVLITHLGDRPGCWEKPGWPNLPPSDWEVGKFSSPHDLHVDERGNIYIVEWLSNGTGKVTKLLHLGGSA
ncbi:MAG: hypothetical protein HYV26_24070 [Candidatus Hydrogenedentes bacterium]|nr:hypothetical protein [Candidatus Hydrogenedentota bacterium]